ncbi:MAG: GNAT family N-acetyltransferase [Campylobacterota bacterium]|nr:GNAT family N-acetyltransferase [Campylobacterota bacterium]
MATEVRVLSIEEIQTLIDWAQQEGWNPGLHDSGIFHSVDPSGYFGAFVNGELVGGISAVRYDDTFGFIGFFIVKPGYRGGHFGPEVAMSASAHLGERNIGIDGVEAKLKNYANIYGFKLAYRNIRFEGTVSSLTSTHQTHSSDKALFAASEIPFDALEAYDRQCFPAQRSSFLSQWFNAPDSVTLVSRKASKVEGMGTIRQCVNGYKIGPLFADSYEIAENIMLGLLTTVPEGEKFYLDIPETNTMAQKLVNTYAMKSVFLTARMYSKNAPDINVNKIFGVTTFELG